VTNPPTNSPPKSTWTGRKNLVVLQLRQRACRINHVCDPGTRPSTARGAARRDDYVLALDAEHSVRPSSHGLDLVPDQRLQQYARVGFSRHVRGFI